MALKLFTGPKDGLNAQVVRAVASQVGQKVACGDFDVNCVTYRHNAHPMGLSPALETTCGRYVAGVNAIVTYLAEGDLVFRGRSAFERGVVDSFLEAAKEIRDVVEPLPADAAKNGVINGFLRDLNSYLETRTYVASERLTVADVVLAMSLVPLYSKVLDAAARKAYTDLNRWFDTVANSPKVKPFIAPAGVCDKAPAWYKASAAPAVALNAAPAAPAAKAAEGKAEGKEGKKKEKKEKKEEPEWKKAANTKKNAPAAELNGGAFDLRVGLITEVREHPDADSLFVEMIDVGEEKPREICSGLRAHLKAEDLLNKNVVVMCNLKPVKMRGIVSSGMVMCSTGAGDNGTTRLCKCPEGAKAGDAIIVEKYETGAPKVQVPVKKVADLLAEFRSDEAGVVCWKDSKCVVKGKGNCSAEHKSAMVK
eukprot:TRINITY_DN7735_c0_g1_i1.p1 TRINITY_DN7735_c0_g1~~TRINITY_DN7735_c0_g1_i1.p1  ORF type:complete len:423 (+),score=216.59 TRINITY_DN7735_c0_g1_i1:45-1313(+)